MINKDYTLLWWGQFVSQVGNRLYLMALSWYFVATINNAEGLFLLFVISSLPSLLFGAFVGPLIEKWNKKRIIIFCDIISGILTGILAFMVYNNVANEPIIYLICFLLNSVNMLFSPAVNSIIPVIIPATHLQKGMSYIKMITFLGQILGAAIGGMLVGLIGVYLTILLNSVSFILSAFSEVFINFEEVVKSKREKYLTSMKEGWKYVYSNKLVKRVTIISVACNLFLPVIFIFIPIIIKTELGLDSIHYGFADAMIPIGSVVIALLLANIRLSIKPLMSLSIGIAGISLCYCAFSFLPSYYIILLALFLYGCFTNFINISVITYFVGTVDSNYRGRFFSILESFSYASISMAYALATLLSSYVTVSQSLIINGACLGILFLISVLWNKKSQINTN
ncbi:MAG: MFS transporter [Muribaculaceae bacterium]|nr:MFS transporter [Muribaculaceae bacterium]